MTPSFRYLIIDDDELDRLTIEAEATRFPFLTKIAACSQSVEAAELINRFHPDIIFADIEMPGISGLDLLRHLHGQPPAIVFITSHPEFAIESYEAEAFDYLLKPVDSERFTRCIFRLRDFCELRTKAFAYDEMQESGCIIIKQGYEKYKLYITDILYLEAMRDYTRIVTSAGQYLVLTTLGGLLDKLPAEKFIRIHRSYVVNSDKIRALKNGKVYLPSVELPVGKQYKNILNEIFR